MKTKTIVTLKKFYFKEVEIEIDNKFLVDMNYQEIADYLVYEWDALDDDDNEDELFDKAELHHCREDDYGTYDIYENGKQVFGGRL
tara:strand:+ start:10330 stop:10587 length:258 start_codon:yes stop_codon:yes gene_type:complete